MSSTASKSLRERFFSIWQYVPGGALLFAVIPLVILSYLGWFYYGAQHLDHALYALTPENMTVTPQPAWISTSNVRDEVFQGARLDRISLLDPQANATIAQAFESHAWVRATTRVTKAVGGKVAVDIVYRQPIAMVYCRPDLPEAEGGVLPVDTDGILLPTRDFSEAQVHDYFFIRFWADGDGVSSRGQTGMPFGDTRVAEALQLCNFLAEERAPQKLQRVYIQNDRRSSGDSPWILILETVDRHQIVWGHRPNAEGVGEPSASDKLKQMLVWLELQRSAQRTGQSLNLMSNAAAVSVSHGNR